MPTLKLHSNTAIDTLVVDGLTAADRQGMCGIDFVIFMFGICSVIEKKTRIWFGMSLVLFRLKKKRFCSDIIVI